MVSVTSTTVIFQLNRIFNLKNNESIALYKTMNMKINRWIFLSLPDLLWVVWRPLSLDLAFVILQKFMGHGILIKDEPDKRIFEVYQKFVLNKLR